VRPADPAFLGFCLARDADVGSKVCAKAGPHEKVGVLCEVGGVYSVVEYSEMPREAAERRGADGALEFNTGNLCIHYYSTAFLAGPCSPAQLPKVYHLAKKVRASAQAPRTSSPRAAQAE
jgi:UDP-N-acetylglucosamine/UDP-N-acetylgalactosamine diphosphorylase